MYYIKLFQENNPRSSFLKWVEVITTSVSWLSLPFGIMISDAYIKCISISMYQFTPFVYQYLRNKFSLPI